MKPRTCECGCCCLEDLSVHAIMANKPLGHGTRALGNKALKIYISTIFNLSLAPRSAFRDPYGSVIMQTAMLQSCQPRVTQVARPAKTVSQVALPTRRRAVVFCQAKQVSQIDCRLCCWALCSRCVAYHICQRWPVPGMQTGSICHAPWFERCATACLHLLRA